MAILRKSLSSWGTDTFKQVLKDELKQLPEGVLPLAKCSMRGGNIDFNSLEVSVLTVSDDGQSIQAKISVFFNEVSAGGSCGFDPTTESAYGEMLVTIDKDSAEAEYKVVFE
ncbi:MAG: glucosamine--fructose-6-phosphate aminotransferase [Gammaproteobacteria bacterium]|nr:glucosamine--fructose-6-phosphate aminotransferase [Gammaproteobacteria bacterium]